MAVKRGSSYQGCVCFAGKRHRKAFSSMEAAEAWEAETLQALKRGEEIHRDGSPAAKTLGGLLKTVYLTRWSGKKAEDALYGNAKDVCEILGMDRPPSSIKIADIDTLKMAYRQRGLSPATVNRKLSALNVLLDFAHKRSYITHKPHIEWESESKGRTRFFTVAEEQAILGYFESVGDTTMARLVAFAIDTGLRMSEALALTPREILPSGVNTATLKGGCDRVVPLTRRAAGIAQSVTNGVLFDIGQDEVERRWNRMRGHLGFEKDPEFVFHTCRHTFCSRLAQSGATLTDIMKLAGHKSITTTLRYAHLCGDRLREAMNKMEGYNPSPSPHYQGSTGVEPNSTKTGSVA